MKNKPYSRLSFVLVLAAWFVPMIALMPRAEAQQSAQAVVTIVVKPAPLVFAAQSFSAQVGLPFSGQLVASGGVAPYSFAIVTSPNPLPWLSIAADGSMKGTPTAATASAGIGLTVQVKDASGATARLVIR